ncbi:MAG: DUF3027 domain-containing protein [Protaetiibacter sp.]
MTDEERARVAREALREITPDATVGELVAQQGEGAHVTTLSFATTMPGYPGWRWTVSVAELPGEAPSVLEVELLPGEGALLAPDWVPWSERLEEYRAAQGAAAGAGLAEEGEFDEDEDDLDDDFDLDDGIDVDPGDSAMLAAEAVHVDEGDEPDPDPGEAGPQPPDAAGLDERSDEDE